MPHERTTTETELIDLSIAPDSDAPDSTRGKTLEWTVGEHGDAVVIEFAAVDATGVYTAISKATLSDAQATALAEAIDEELAQE